MKKVIMFAMSMQIASSIFCSDQEIPSENPHLYRLWKDESSNTFKYAICNCNFPEEKVKMALAMTKIEEKELEGSVWTIISYIPSKDEEPEIIEKTYKHEKSNKPFILTNIIKRFSRICQETKDYELNPTNKLIFKEDIPHEIRENNQKRMTSTIKYMKNFEHSSQEMVQYLYENLSQLQTDFFKAELNIGTKVLDNENLDKEKLNTLFREDTVKNLQSSYTLIEPHHALLPWIVSQKKYFLDLSDMHFIKKTSEQIEKKIGPERAFTPGDINCLLNFKNYINQTIKIVLGQRRLDLGIWQEYVLFKAIDWKMQNILSEDNQSLTKSLLFTDKELENPDIRIFDTKLQRLLLDSDTTTDYYSDKILLQYDDLAAFLKNEEKYHLKNEAFKKLLAEALKNSENIDPRQNKISIQEVINPLAEIHELRREQILYNILLFSGSFRSAFAIKPSVTLEKEHINHTIYNIAMLLESALRPLNEENLKQWQRSTPNKESLRKKAESLYKVALNSLSKAK